MPTRYMHMRAKDRAFQDRPIALDALSVMDAFDPFLGAMVYGPMHIAMTRQLGIGLQFIGAYGRTIFNICKNVRLQCRAPDVFDNLCHNIALALEHSKHNCLARCAAPAFATTA